MIAFVAYLVIHSCVFRDGYGFRSQRSPVDYIYLDHVGKHHIDWPSCCLKVKEETLEDFTMITDYYSSTGSSHR
jgi:hypothetical protein